MSDTSLITQRKILAFAAVVEIGTGLVLMVDPAVAVALLLGTNLSGVGGALGRVAGVAVLSLGLACWRGRHSEASAAALRGMLTYNSLVPLYLAHLAALRHVGGPLIWPAVALHAVVASLLAWTWRSERRAEAGATDAQRRSPR